MHGISRHAVVGFWGEFPWEFEVLGQLQQLASIKGIGCCSAARPPQAETEVETVAGYTECRDGAWGVP